MPTDSRRTRTAATATAVLLAFATAGGMGVHWWRTHNVGPVERGWRLASQHGCLSCHGQAGRVVDPHPDGTGGAPSFSHDDVADYARDAGELREWILEGKPRRLREEEGDAPPALLGMPAFRGVVSEDEADDLVAWIAAISDFREMPGPARAGHDVAASLGCFGCHGPGGRGDTPNPGSLKGYIPSWSGADYPELVKDDAELAEWIRGGSPRRLRENPAAAFFMGRQLVRMPGFGSAVTDGELRQIGAYIAWLRQGSTAADAGAE